ncbi:hypothetical protein KR054_008645 [Drosophila jambulina]|nr:hypothetical protein KR054_008645 [Drosophila jambulina]
MQHSPRKSARLNGGGATPTTTRADQQPVSSGAGIRSLVNITTAAAIPSPATTVTTVASQPRSIVTAASFSAGDEAAPHGGSSGEDRSVGEGAGASESSKCEHRQLRAIRRWPKRSWRGKWSVRAAAIL